MLAAMRDGAGSWIAKIFLGLLVLSFAVWGIGDIFRARPDTAVATVGDVEISQGEFTYQFNLAMRRLQQRFGGALTQQQARDMGLVDTTLRGVIDRALFDQAAFELGLAVDKATVLQEIKKNPIFQDEFKQFDSFRFQQVLQRNDLSEQGFLDSYTGEMIRAQLFDGIGAGAFAPKQIVDAFYRYQRERRIAEILTVPHAAVTGLAEPEEAALEEFHREHAVRFTAPEYRGVSVVTLSPDDLMDGVAVSAEEIASEYEARAGEFVKPELREVEQILVDSEETAKQIAAQLAEGKDFYSVARELSGQQDDDVKLGLIAKGDLLEELADPVYALAEGVASPPLNSVRGWHIVRVTKIEPGSRQSLSDVRDRLTSDVRRQKALDAMFELANKLEDALAGGASLGELSQSFGLRYVQLAAIDSTGRDRQGNVVEAAPKAAEFLRAVFAAEQGDEPVLTETESESYFALMVTEVIPPALRPLADVRDSVKAGWLADERAKKAKTTAEDLAGRARGGASLASLASAGGYGVAATDPLTRQDSAALESVSVDVVQALFQATHGEVVTGSNRSGDAQVVVRLTDIEVAQPGADADGVAKMRELLAGTIAGDLRAQFRKALEQDIAVTVNNGVLETLFDGPSMGRF